MGPRESSIKVSQRFTWIGKYIGFDKKQLKSVIK